MGTASSLTPERFTQAVELARKGIPRVYIAAKLKVDRVTLWDWLDRGRKILAGEIEPPPEAGGIHPDYAAFVLAMDDADADAVIAAANDITTNPRGHAGQQWWLERTRSEVFGARQQVEHSGTVAQIVVVNYAQLTDAELFRPKAIEGECEVVGTEIVRR